jgi:AcrR family transcriptional regulator
MTKRGDQLRQHILWVAKDLFLEMGFERTSMDVVALRAETSKRSLYAHFENKEKLFLAVIELVRTLFLSKLKEPHQYSKTPTEALVLFCGRYLETLLYEPSIRMCRLTIGEVGRFRAGSLEHFDVIFEEAQRRLSVYLKTTFKLSSRAASDAARNLLGRIIYPRFHRVLFGVEPPIQKPGTDLPSSDFDLKPIRKAVIDLVKSFGSSDN